MTNLHVPEGREGGDGVGRGFPERPNVVWILTDQHRHHALGYAGDPNLHTPTLDAMAHGGLRCRRGGISGYALCCPFRGSLLTGRWPHHCIDRHEGPMPEGQPTVAEPFRAAGYHTAWFGKWHVDGAHERDGRAAFHIVPPERRGGFDEWVGYEDNNSQWDTWVHGGEGETAFHERLEGYETDALTVRFVDHLERRAASGPGEPFFAALSVQPPHWPLQCPREYRRLRGDEIALRANVPPGSAAETRARESAPGYYGMIENFDANVGWVMDALRRLGVAERTHVLIFADHGEMLGSHGHFGKVLPYEESIRIPLLLGGDHQYNHCLKGATDALINHLDIAPTSLGLAGIDVPAWMEGHDYSHHRVAGRDAPADPDATLLQACERREESPAYRGIVTADGWKYAATAQGAWLMFHLDDDPYEMANLAQHPRYFTQRGHLHARLRELLAAVGDEFACADPG